MRFIRFVRRTQLTKHIISPMRICLNLRTHRKIVYCIQVNIIFLKYITSLYIRKYIMNSSQALNLIEYILNFSKCSILVKNVKLKQKFGLLTT